MGARLLLALPGHLRTSMTPQQAREILRRRFARREADFLTLIRQAVFDHPSSPYHRLMRLAGCEYGDLERLVAADGIEGALAALFRSGVYLTGDEYKGRQPIRRGGSTFEVEPTQFWNPLARVHFRVHSGGSRGTPTPVGLDLTHVREGAADTGLFFDARGGLQWIHGFWGIPGSSTLTSMLRLAIFGVRPARWFSQVNPSAPGLHPRYRWSVRVARLGAALAGVRLPAPKYVRPQDAHLVARWMAGVIRRGAVPHLTTFASAAVRVCLAALDEGLDLRGAQFTLGGEPTTEARLAVIRRAGAHGVPRYACSEFGQMAYGCLAPEAPDDLHLASDLHAFILVERPDGASGPPPGALLVTCLRPTAPLFLMNLALGDRATMGPRACGCPLEALGWTTHLQAIRSYEKLTAGGMTFRDTDVIRALEDVLPARFGGAPTDYQLVEEEGADGKPRLRLLVHPSVGPVDLRAVADAFLEAIGAGSGAERVMQHVWRDAGMLLVERTPPRATTTGKILHLHQQRRDLLPCLREHVVHECLCRPDVGRALCDGDHALDAHHAVLRPDDRQRRPIADHAVDGVVNGRAHPELPRRQPPRHVRGAPEHGHTLPARALEPFPAVRAHDGGHHDLHRARERWVRDGGCPAEPREIGPPLRPHGHRYERRVDDKDVVDQVRGGEEAGWIAPGAWQVCRLGRPVGLELTAFTERHQRRRIEQPQEVGPDPTRGQLGLDAAIQLGRPGPQELQFDVRVPLHEAPGQGRGHVGDDRRVEDERSADVWPRRSCAGAARQGDRDQNHDERDDEPQAGTQTA
ncbi:MAG: hypothetical protein QN120_06025 [Armatimonadota bacterium]|nr:hypothetical protein [Armatimonadota bacterium]